MYIYCVTMLTYMFAQAMPLTVFPERQGLQASFAEGSLRPTATRKSTTAVVPRDALLKPSRPAPLCPIRGRPFESTKRFRSRSFSSGSSSFSRDKSEGNRRHKGRSITAVNQTATAASAKLVQMTPNVVHRHILRQPVAVKFHQFEVTLSQSNREGVNFLEATVPSWTRRPRPSADGIELAKFTVSRLGIPPPESGSDVFIQLCFENNFYIRCVQCEAWMAELHFDRKLRELKLVTGTCNHWGAADIDRFFCDCVRSWGKP